MDFYHIKDNYINYLRSFDSKVAENKNEKRPYVGIVLSIDGIDYFAPFTSPKPKHLTMKNGIDFRKIDGGKLGAINLNNMIPVLQSELIQFTIAKVPEGGYRRLLQNQYTFIENDMEEIQLNALKLRTVIFTDDSKLNNHNREIKKRCCNLPLLESIYMKYKEN